MLEIYNKTDNWLLPEAQSGTADLSEVSEAIEFAAAQLTKRPGDLPVVSFSCGKDSLLTLVVVSKALEKVGRSPTELTIATAVTGYEDERFAVWLDYLRSVLFPRFNWTAVTKNPIASYAVETLGLGMPPTNMPNLRHCNLRWKGAPLEFLRRQILDDNGGGDTINFSGTRAEESRRRADRFKEQGRLNIIGGTPQVSPIAFVSSATLWKYLEGNLDSIGVDYSRLVEYYKGKTRDGCWVCSYGKEELVGFKLFVRNYQKEAWDSGVWESIDDLPAGWSPTIYRSARVRLEKRKQFYNEIVTAAEGFGCRSQFFTPLIEDFIAESWRFTEQFIDRGAEWAGVRTWNELKDEYQPAKPYLHDLTFYTKTTKSGRRVDYLHPGAIFFKNKLS